MTYRSRTNLFLSYRDSRSSYSIKGKGKALYDEDGEETTALMDDLELGSTSDALPPIWIDLADKVDGILLGLKPKCEDNFQFRRNEIDGLISDITR